jgi:hypothetical protein
VRIRLAAAPLAAALALGLTAAGCGSAAGPPGTGLSLTVERGPLQPVSQVGQPNTAPVQDASVVVSTESGGTVATALTDSAGRAVLGLAAGAYTVSLRTCPGAIALPSAISITVTEGELTSRTVECDTGIR